jgi:hypothetical protein
MEVTVGNNTPSILWVECDVRLPEALSLAPDRRRGLGGGGIEIRGTRSGPLLTDLVLALAQLAQLVAQLDRDRPHLILRSENVLRRGDELVRQAAQGTVLYNDDTTARILKFTAAARAEALPPGAKQERTGIFTSGVVAETAHGLIALFKTGPCHAGEHLAEVLDQRQDGGPPIQMSDALARNRPGDHPTQAASCIPHGRRKFVEVYDAFPTEVAFVLETLRPVFVTDQQAKQEGLSPPARLLLHQQESGPRMQMLHDWMERQIEDHLVEPNSGLGQARAYMRNHWVKLTLFLRVPGAPLDNNLCERALKKAILHRKNSLFYRTLNGAKVGDLFMSLIHTAELHQVEPFDYLVALLRHAPAVALEPAAWMPWNYSAALARLASEASDPAPD